MKTFKLYAPAYITLILFTLLAVIGIKDTHAQKDSENITNNYKYNIEETDNYIEKINNITIKNLSKITIDNIDIKDYLKEKDINMLLEDFEQEKIYSKYIIYSNKNSTNKEIKIIECANGNYIISNESLEYTQDICE